MTTEIIEQINAIDPSVKDALFRRLLYEQSLAYLRQNDKKIIGFDLDLERNNSLAGYTVIAIQKHTIIAYKSDLNERSKLILFPDEAKSVDPEFQLNDLYVRKTIYRDDSFEGEVIVEGKFKDVVQDLLPSVKDDSLDDVDFDHLFNTSKFKKTKNKPQDKDKSESKTTAGIMEDQGLARLGQSNPNNSVTDDSNIELGELDELGELSGQEWDEDEQFYDPDFGDAETTGESIGDIVSDATDEDLITNCTDENNGTSSDRGKKTDDLISEEIKDPRSCKLNSLSHSFHTMTEVTNYVTSQFAVDPVIATQIVNTAICKSSDLQTQIDIAIIIFIKLFETHKIGEDPDEGAF